MNNPKYNASNEIVKFYKHRIADIMSSFFIKFFTKLKCNDDFKKCLMETNDEMNLDSAYDKFENYIDLKYSITLNDLELGLNIYMREYTNVLLDKKIITNKKKDVLNVFFKKCCKKIINNILNEYDTQYNLKQITQYNLKQITNKVIEDSLYDIIPINLISENYDFQQQEQKDEFNTVKAVDEISKSHKNNESENNESGNEKSSHHTSFNKSHETSNHEKLIQLEIKKEIDIEIKQKRKRKLHP